jgi:formamidopyrimidine-DNA glycosylase
MSEALVGKTVEQVSVVDVTASKGSWRYGSIVQPPDVFLESLEGATILAVERVANSILLPIGTERILALGYVSGRILYHEPGKAAPPKSCLRLMFSDGSQLSVTISMWGLVRLLDRVDLQQFVAHWYGPGVEPLSDEYTWERFQAAASGVEDPRLSAKKFLHAFEPCYHVAGIDSGYAIDILHRCGTHPKRTLASLSREELQACYHAVNTVMEEAVCGGGRSDAMDLFGQRGRFVPHACKETLGTPCHECGTPIEKLKLEGGSSYFCPTCQPLP